MPTRKISNLSPELIINSIPKRIVSLTPALTEILFAIGLGHRVVGVTDSCDYPAEVKGKPHVSCWFDPDLEKLVHLKPDLVMGLETAHNLLKPKLESEGVRVIFVNPVTVNEAVTDMVRIGELLGAHEKTETLVGTLHNRLSKLDARVRAIPKEKRITASRILELEDDRFCVAGPLSFQYDVILRAGGQNVTGSIKEAYPRVTLTQFRQWDPEMVFSCGFDLNSIPGLADNLAWRSLKAVQSRKVFVFDCGLTCRTGPRIVDMVEILFNTLYGDGGSD
jgi:iron complex transport system substrate-binding protein